MDGLVRYVAVDVLLAAGSPVLVAYMVNYLVAKKSKVYDLLGGGQLCLYSTTLSFVVLSQLIPAPAPSGGPGIDKSWAAIGFAVIILVSSVTLAVAIHEGMADQKALTITKRRVTFFSFLSAIGAAILGGLYKQSWGLW